MKKLGLFTLLLACITVGFGAPVSANRAHDVEPRATVEMNAANRTDGNVMTDINRAANNIGTGFNRAGDDIRRGMDRTGDEMQRTFGVRDNTGVRTYDNGYRTNNFRGNNYRTAAADDGFDWGWLGLLGLFGLAGLRNRGREREHA
jgi:hypothetical protein